MSPVYGSQVTKGEAVAVPHMIASNAIVKSIVFMLSPLWYG
jgi:hypothetical protein